MMLLGVDYHPSFQTIAFFVEETGECGEQDAQRRLCAPHGDDLRAQLQRH
jgi:hypothetical protein